MRIDGFQNIPAVLQSFRVEKALKSELKNQTEALSTSVSLSSFAEVLQSLQRETAQTTAARGAKVEGLAQQVQSGKLSVDLEKLASSLVNNQVIA